MGAMTVKCCGKVRNSKFCPDCGRPLGEPHGLGTLLAHCRAQSLRYSKEAEKARQKPEDERFPGVIDSADDAARKWTAWHDALDALIEKQP